MAIYLGLHNDDGHYFKAMTDRTSGKYFATHLLLILLCGCYLVAGVEYEGKVLAYARRENLVIGMYCVRRGKASNWVDVRPRRET